MASKKQIILPIAVLVGGLGMAFAFASMKQAPVEKPEQDNRPLVSIKPLNFDAITLDVKSHGIVKPKNHTELVAQVSGQVVSLSEQFVQGG